jgi:hypothetical protein
MNANRVVSPRAVRDELSGDLGKEMCCNLLDALVLAWAFLGGLAWVNNRC